MPHMVTVNPKCKCTSDLASQVDVGRERWTTILAQYNSLLEASFNGDIHQCICKWDELEKAIDEVRGALYYKSTAFTNNKYFQQEHQDFITEALDKIKKINSIIFKNILSRLNNHPEYKCLQDRMDSLYKQPLRHDNSRKLEQLISKYNHLQDQATPKIDGRAVSLGEINRLLLSSNRRDREKAYRSYLEADLHISDEATDIYIQLVKSRHKQAKDYGYENYLECHWEDLGRKFYKPDNIRKFRQDIKEHIAPILNRLRRQKAESLKLGSLRPWDMHYNKEELVEMNFDYEHNDILEKAVKIHSKIDKELGERLGKLISRGAFDIEDREGKIQQAYTDYWPQSQKPIVVMRMVNSSASIHTLMHEIGHALHHDLIPKEYYIWHRLAPLEFAEFIAQSFELLTLPFVDEVFSKEASDGIKTSFFEKILSRMVNNAILDEFQEWIYTTNANNLDAETVKSRYIEIERSYNLAIDWMGLDNYQAINWQQYRIFAWPLYTIEYCIAWVAVLKLWDQFTYSPQKSIGMLKESMRLGHTKDVKELFDIAGVPLKEVLSSVASLAKPISKELGFTD